VIIFTLLWDCLAGKLTAAIEHYIVRRMLGDALMRWRTFALFACMILYGVSVPAHAAQDCGPNPTYNYPTTSGFDCWSHTALGMWKIFTTGGPVPLCILTQKMGNNLNGSCVGPQAAGTINGTVVGSVVQWQWQWTSCVGNGAGALEFLGTLQSDDTISGKVERKEDGLSFDFTGRRVWNKLFFSSYGCTPSPKQTSPVSASATSVPMRMERGIYVVPIIINDAITLDFIVDSGSTDVSIPGDVVMTLMRTGTLKDADFLEESTYILADGSRVPSRTFHIRSLKVGNKILENVIGSVASMKGSLLLGQSFLGRFKSWSVDNVNHALVFE
jgi:predicted aspartyl protease